MKTAQSVPAWLFVFNAAFLAFLLGPVLIVILTAFTPTNYIDIPTTEFSLRWFRAIFERREFIDAFYVSLVVGLSATVISVVLGTAAAFGLVRYGFAGRDVLNAFVLSPRMVPTIVIGVALLQYFSTLRIAATWTAIIIAHVVVCAPYVVRTVAASLAGLDRRLEQAAMNLGARPWQAFVHVTLPAIAPGVIAGAILAFITSFDELTVSLFVTGPKLVTLPIRIYQRIEYMTDPVIASISACVVVLTVVGVLLVERLFGLGRLLRVS